MKKYRKIGFLSIVAVVFMLTFMSFTTFATDSTLMLSAETVKVEKGEKEAVVNVTIKNNPGIASLAFDVIYDEKYLTLKSFTYNKEALAGAATVPFNPSAKPACLSMISPTANITGDFVFATLYFDINENAVGEYDIILSCNEDNIYDVNENNLDFRVENGKITVIENINPTKKTVETNTSENSTGMSETQSTEVPSIVQPTETIEENPTDQIATELRQTTPKETSPVVFKRKSNPIKVSVKTRTVKLKKLKKKAQRIKPITIKKAKGRVKIRIETVKKTRKKYFKFNSKGTLTIKKWKKAKKGTYKIKTKVISFGTSKYLPKSIVKTIKISIK